MWRAVTAAAGAALTLTLAAPAVGSAAPTAEPGVLRVWPLGDSITFGNIGPSSGLPGGYRGFLDTDLQAAGVPHRFIGSWRVNSTALLDARGQSAHDGHGGFLVDDIAAGLDGPYSGHGYSGGRWVRGLDPDVVLLHIGTNDITHRADPAVRYPTRDGRVDSASRAQRARFVADLTVRVDRLVQKIHRLRPHARIVLATVVPIGADVCDRVTPEYAAAIRGLVPRERRAGIPVVLADVWAAYTQTDSGGCHILPGLISADTVHPTSWGYAVMAAVFERALLTVSS